MTASNEPIITFDCYGTLVDWRGGIEAAFAKMAAHTGRTANPDLVLRIHEVVEPILQAGPYRSYRAVLDDVAQATAYIENWTIPHEDRRFLSESLAAWLPFADTNTALKRLRNAGYRLGILSNIDDDLWAMTRRHFSVDFDLIVTAQQVKCYKPAPAHFLAAREQIGSEAWLHAAQSNFHDIVPANTFGIQTAWINRRNESPLPGGVPTFEVGDLAALADRLTSAK